jgi:CheY-like chemotaxis protein
MEQALIGKRLLVVEDSPILLALLKNILLKSGATVRLVADGREAVEAVAAEPFDAVLMDVSMPGMNGLDATRAIRAMHADQVGGPTLPIIGISAHAIAGDREECLAAGMTDYLTKPVQLSVLVRAVGRAIEGAVS